MERDYAKRLKFNPKANLAELPAELVREISELSDVDDRILSVFREGGGVLNISEVLVGYYKLFNKTKTRTYITATLYRMARKGLLKKTKNKGEYALVKT